VSWVQYLVLSPSVLSELLKLNIATFSFVFIEVNRFYLIRNHICTCEITGLTYIVLIYGITRL